ncbi:hypothetical protein [Photobacterium damselae]|uniref:hypothetical protein n=1 Tax=Photobacterium damselae TaxID=38293 RepID=UPI001484F429|nr:hypothetical protein [Photobacterium damselae]
MKKIVLASFVFISLLLIGCSDTDSEKENKTEQVKEKKHEDMSIKEKKDKMMELKW